MQGCRTDLAPRNHQHGRPCRRRGTGAACGMGGLSERAIRLVVPFAAGGAVDGVARLIGKALATNLDQPIAIENRGGAGGIIGMDAVAHAPADGYTMLLSHSGVTAMPRLYDKLPFDPRATATSPMPAASCCIH
jgi:tripartite-type tricarboxylate transporter receptor subunit TctC